VCGIAGVIHLDPRKRVDPAMLRRMSGALRHRGPDGEGLVADGSVGFGHRRLAIVDIEGGAQPMTSADGSTWLVCNGEIYNHPELKPVLEAAGHRYRTRCDSETILHAYEAFGEDCVERLRGMFAFALWDGRRGRLLLARDPLGIKPLYYTVRSASLAFASEIKALLASGLVRPSFDRDVLPEYLASGFVAGEDTFFVGVRRLEPGHVLTWTRDEGFRVREYWKPPSVGAGNGASLRDEARELRRILGEAVRRHLMSDVPVGLFLSGGVDSTALAALMAPMVREPIRTFAVGFDEPGASELPFARAVAGHLGTIHHEVTVSRDEYFRALPELIWHEDEPLAFPASVPLYFVSRLAAQHVKVVLTGEGSDELFSGYNRYRIAAWNAIAERTVWRRVPRWVRARVRAAVPWLPAALRRNAARTFLAAGPDLRTAFYEPFAVFSGALQSELLAGIAASPARDPYAMALRFASESGGGVLDRILYADLRTYLAELLMKQDQMSMAASIESRVPFLDDEVVRFAVSLPARYKLRGLRTKAVLKEAVRDILPPGVLHRRKMGFPVPIGPWLAGGARRVVSEYVLGPRALSRGLFRPAALRRLVAAHDATGRHGDRLWLLVTLEMWHRVFLDGEEPGRIARCAVA
jgi:asparagine synthase (glutamine-hydrolysing)